MKQGIIFYHLLRGLLKELFLLWDVKGDRKGSYKFGSCKRKFRENGMLKDGRK